MVAFSSDPVAEAAIRVKIIIEEFIMKLWQLMRQSLALRLTTYQRLV